MSNEAKELPVWKWEEELGVEIIDPDGFRDLALWRDTCMTRADFERRVVRSTCKFHPRTEHYTPRTRGFEIARGFENHEVNLPKRETKNAAGYDFEATETVTIPPIWMKMFQHITSMFSVLNLRGYPKALELPEGEQERIASVMKPTLVKTGVKAYMPEDEALFLYNRSSNPLKRFLLLANSVGIIDADYYSNPDNDGHIMFQFINFGLFPVHIKKGERIGQGVFQKYLKADGDVAEGERKGGHGSTDK